MPGLSPFGFPTAPGPPPPPVLAWTLYPRRPVPPPVAPATDIERAVVARIVAAALPSGTPAPLHMPEGYTYPCICYYIADDEPGLNLGGHDGTSTARFEFKCMDKGYGNARKLAESLRQTWPPLVNATLSGVKILGCWTERASKEYEWGDDASDDGAHTSEVDLMIRYRLPIPS